MDTYEAEHIPPLQLDFLAGTGKKGSRHHTQYSSSRSDNNNYSNNITCLLLKKVYIYIKYNRYRGEGINTTHAIDKN